MEAEKEEEEKRERINRLHDEAFGMTFTHHTLRPEALGCYQCRVEDFVVVFKTDGGSEPEPEPEPGGGDNDDGDGNGGDDDEGEGGGGGGGGEGNPNEFDDCIVPPGMDPGDVGC